MCYDIKTSLEKQLRRALLDGDGSNATEILEKLKTFSKQDVELHHASGFDHPQVIIYTQEEPKVPRLATWGLVPENTIAKEDIWNKTLNARGETIFEKPSFKESAHQKRCIIYLEGFYEHMHNKGKTYPHFIYPKKDEMFAVAGLYTTWKEPETKEDLTTFSIVTTKANALMADIHNNPKLKEPRMPLILPKDKQDDWLKEVIDEADIVQIQELIKPLDEIEMSAHTVAPLKGKQSFGNTPQASEPKRYAELEVSQGSLF